jgi:hypothetical protein
VASLRAAVNRISPSRGGAGGGYRRASMAENAPPSPSVSRPNTAMIPSPPAVTRIAEHSHGCLANRDALRRSRTTSARWTGDAFPREDSTIGRCTGNRPAARCFPQPRVSIAAAPEGTSRLGVEKRVGFRGRGKRAGQGSAQSAHHFGPLTP